jgi:septal ring factor EnvC (AmiA/AmiB activator)
MNAVRVIVVVVALAGVEQERAGVRDQLDREKTALETLEGQRATAKAVLEELERVSQQAAERTAVLERQSRALQAQVAKLEVLEDQTDAALRAQLKAVGPRLTVLYRAGRQDKLGFLLSASDFATMMRRSRSLDALVREDVEALQQTRRVMRFEALLSRRADRMRDSSAQALAMLKTESKLAQARRAAFDDLLASIEAKGAQKSRIVKDLEQSDYQLSQLIAEMSASASSGFRALRGHLPYPTIGMIEVGYGNVFNPRFNTTTLHKGLDFHARGGTPVRAVADATVAYAGWLKGYGNLIILDHGGGYHSLMAHLASIEVEPGASIQRGAVLGLVGDSGSLKGPYLYFEIRQRGDAVDPAPWLDEEAQ